MVGSAFAWRQTKIDEEDGLRRGDDGDGLGAGDSSHLSDATEFVAAEEASNRLPYAAPSERSKETAVILTFHPNHTTSPLASNHSFPLHLFKRGLIDQGPVNGE